MKRWIIWKAELRQRSSPCCLSSFLPSTWPWRHGFFCSSVPGSGNKYYESKEAVAGVGAAASWSLDYRLDRVSLKVTVTRDASWLCTHWFVANIVTTFYFGHSCGFFWQSFLESQDYIDCIFSPKYIEITYSFYSWVDIGFMGTKIYTIWEILIKQNTKLYVQIRYESKLLRKKQIINFNSWQIQWSSPSIENIN